MRICWAPRYSLFAHVSCGPFLSRLSLLLHALSRLVFLCRTLSLARVFRASSVYARENSRSNNNARMRPRVHTHLHILYGTHAHSCVAQLILCSVCGARCGSRYTRTTHLRVVRVRFVYELTHSLCVCVCACSAYIW